MLNAKMRPQFGTSLNQPGVISTTCAGRGIGVAGNGRFRLARPLSPAPKQVEQACKCHRGVSSLGVGRVNK